MVVVGLGHIGARVVNYAHALGMRVMGVTRSPERSRRAELGLTRLVGLVDLAAVLADADFVVLAVPLVAETFGLIGARELSSMKSTAYLVNVARAGVIVEHALYQALKEAPSPARRSTCGTAIPPTANSAYRPASPSTRSTTSS